MRLQHKFLDQAQSRMTTGFATATPSHSNTDERYFDDDWGAGAVASEYVAGPAPNRSEDTAAIGGGVVAENEVDLEKMDSVAKGDIQIGTDQDDSKECCICLDAPAAYIFVPCLHMCVCANCQIPYADGTEKECPMCRETFTKVGKVF